MVKHRVKTAALLVSCFGVLLAVEAIGYWVVQDRFHAEHFVRHVLGALLWVLIAWGLARGRRWAWWVVICIGGPLSVLGAIALVFLLFSPSLRAGVINVHGMGSLGIPVGVLSVASLAGAVAILLTREARDAFFPPPQ